MRVEHHLLRLARIGPDERSGAAVAELDVSDLQFGPLAADDRPIFRPVELERLARQKRQRHESAAAARLLFLLPRGPPVASEGRHAIVGAVVAERGQISVSCLAVRFCLRDFPASCRSIRDSLSAYGSSLLGRSGMLNFGSTLSERRSLRTVFLDSPVRRDISRIEKWSR